MTQGVLDFQKGHSVPPNVDTPGFHHSNAGPTEVGAARAVRKGRGEKQMRMLAAYANSANGLTDYEMEAKCQMHTPSVTSCRNSLIENGYVVKTPYTRPGRAMLDVAVWQITPAGRKALRDAAVPPLVASRSPKDAA